MGVSPGLRSSIVPFTLIPVVLPRATSAAWRGAGGYRRYWSNNPGTVYTQGTVVDVNVPPYVHSGLAKGTTYYYAISSRSLTSVSPPSAEIAATAGASSQPSNLVVSIAGTDVQLTWDAVAIADTYSIYWENEPGVTPLPGNPIPAVTSQYLHTELSAIPYYYISTAINGYGESMASEEGMAFPPLEPPAPIGLSATQRARETTVDLAWYPVPGVNMYNVYRCWVWVNSPPDGCTPSTFGCYEPWVQIGNNISDTFFVDWTTDTVAYWYYVTASNPCGSSVPSDWTGLCVEP